MKITNLFKNYNPVIGVIHLMPSPGFKGFEDIEKSLSKALEDLNAFEKGGVDGIFIENNYDLPHKIIIEPETIAYMTFIGTKIQEITKLPIGISVLWNDYKASLAIAKAINASFIRIPAFVDDVITDFGEVYQVSKEVKTYQKKINAENILLLTDIQVKHSKMIDTQKTLEMSYKEAIKAGSDGIIVTGEWTGDPPTAETISRLNKISKKIPIFIGSGVDKENITSLAKEAFGFIVSTSLKTGNKIKSHRNLMTEEERIDIKKVKELMRELN